MIEADSTSLSTSLLAISYFGDVVFAVSGALTAARYHMDVLGFVLIGTITGIGGGTVRDLLLGRTVWWTQQPFELGLCVAASLFTYFMLPYVKSSKTREKAMVWADALGLSVFGILGCHTALAFGAPVSIAIFMGMITATGGGMIRDVLTNTQPMILGGQIYATAALLGAASYAGMLHLGVQETVSELVACTAAFALRASEVVFNIGMGPPGELFLFRTKKSDDT